MKRILNRFARQAKPGLFAGRSMLMLFAGVGGGVMAAYYLDPGRGRRRRAQLGDRLRHVLRLERRFLGKATRDAKNRGTGVVARMRGRFEDVADDVLFERVRSELGHHVTHARAIEVAVRDGVVKLSGPIMRDECDGLIRAIRHVPGVCAIEDALEPHDDDQDPAPMRAAARKRWTPAARLIAAAAGLGLGTAGLMRRGGIGSVLAIAGGSLLARAATNRSLRQIIGLGGAGSAITIRKSITVAAPVEEVWALWSDLENLPRFFEHVVEVDELPDGRSEWHVRGPGGMPVQWLAKIVDHVPREHMTWRTVSGRISHTGTVRFEPIDDETTRVHVRMSYCPPAGSIGHSLAALFGQDPKHTLDRDLMRMKSLLERGESLETEGESQPRTH